MTVQMLAGLSAALFAGAVVAACFMARRPTYPKAILCMLLCLGAYALVWVFVRKDIGQWFFGKSGHVIIGAASAVMVIYFLIVDRMLRRIKEM